MRRRSTRVAWALLAIWVVSVVALVVLSVANGNFERQSLVDTVGLLLAFAAFMGVGALVVANRPGNAIGWVFSAIGLLAVTGAMAEEYAGYAVRSRPGLLSGWPGLWTPRTASSTSRWACWSWPRWCRWSSASAAPGARSGFSSSGSPTPAPCCR